MVPGSISGACLQRPPRPGRLGGTASRRRATGPPVPFAGTCTTTRTSGSAAAMAAAVAAPATTTMSSAPGAARGAHDEGEHRQWTARGGPSAAGEAHRRPEPVADDGIVEMGQLIGAGRRGSAGSSTGHQLHPANGDHARPRREQCVSRPCRGCPPRCRGQTSRACASFARPPPTRQRRFWSSAAGELSPPWPWRACCRGRARRSARDGRARRVR